MKALKKAAKGEYEYTHWPSEEGYEPELSANVYRDERERPQAVRFSVFDAETV